MSLQSKRIAVPGAKRPSAGGDSWLGADNVTAPGGATVRVVVRLIPASDAVSVTGVDAATLVVVTVKPALVAPAGTVTLAGTPAAALPLDRATRSPPVGAALVSETVPAAFVPPVTLVGLTPRADSDAGGGGGGGVVDACGVNRRDAENGPNTPAEFAARTRHHRRCVGRPESVACDTVTVGFAVSGGVSDELFAT